MKCFPFLAFLLFASHLKSQSCKYGRKFAEYLCRYKLLKTVYKIKEDRLWSILSARLTHSKTPQFSRSKSIFS